MPSRPRPPTKWRTGRSAAAFVAVSLLAVGTSMWGAPAGGAAQSATSTNLTGVSCVPGGVCFAVGYSYPGTHGQPRTAIERRNGSRWSAQPSPNAPVYKNELHGVSCRTATFCVAVGESAPGGATTSNSLVERWDGKRWSIVKTPNVGALNAVSCSSATHCFAGLSLRWNGKTWSTVKTKLFASSVSCTSTTSCVGVNGPTSERWNGKTWLPTSIPQQCCNEAIGVSGVWCTSANNCFAAGGQFEGLGQDFPVVERWNGKAWSQMTIPIPTAGTSDFYAVSCSGPKHCFVVGRSDNSSVLADPNALTEQWDGTAWSLAPAALPAGRQSSLSAVSCLSPTDCTAVGASYAPPVNGLDGPPHPLFEHWNGTSWAIA